MPRGSSRTPTIYDERQLALSLGPPIHRRFNSYTGVEYGVTQRWRENAQRWMGAFYGRSPAVDMLRSMARDRLNRRADMVIEGRLGTIQGGDFYYDDPPPAGAEPVQEVREAPVRLQRDVFPQPAPAPPIDWSDWPVRSPQRGAPEVFEGPVHNGPWAGQRISSMTPVHRIFVQQEFRVASPYDHALTPVPDADLGIHTYEWHDGLRDGGYDGWYLRQGV